MCEGDSQIEGGEGAGGGAQTQRTMSAQVMSHSGKPCVRGRVSEKGEGGGRGGGDQRGGQRQQRLKGTDMESCFRAPSSQMLHSLPSVLGFRI